MKLTAIDKAFGVGESTGQGKSMLIRKMFKIGTFNPSAAPSAAIKPGPHSRPAPIRAPAGRCPSPRQKRPIAGTPIRAYIVTISN